MNRLNDILHELGISKVKLAKFLGVSRQMIYNYLELDDINKWPKDKKVLLLNLLGIKSSDELKDIKVDTDYILDVETRMNLILEESEGNGGSVEINKSFTGLKKRDQELINDILDVIKERLEEDKTEESYDTFRYMYHFIQSLDSAKELRYILAYISKATGFTKPLEFSFSEEEQFVFESIMFSAMTLYNSYNNGGVSTNKIAESHRRFVNQIEHKIEEKMSRTLELNSAKVQAMKELGYTEINDHNASEILEKMAEIESRKIAA